MMKKFFNWATKKPDENSNLHIDFEQERFISPMITWLHSWSLNETRNTLSQSLFNQLPNEIILHIFRFLTVHDLCNISLVCRSFKIIADDDQLWKCKLYTNDNLHSQSYKHMYMEWIHEKNVRNRKLRLLERNYMMKTACIVCLPPSRRIQSINKSKSIGGFNQHPNSSQDLIINFSVDLDRTASELISLLKKTSSFQQQWQQPVIFKQMIQRYYRFLQLKASNPSNILLIPTLDIEIIWQTHLLRPEMYRNDCLRLFHRIIDHSLIINNINQLFKQEAFFDTCHLYEQRFGEIYCTLPMIDKNNENLFSSLYSYWDKTYFQFSDKLINNYENPFSFTHADFILDGKWLNLCQQFLFNTSRRHSIWNRIFNRTTTEIHLNSDTLKRLKKSYERFLYMATKYPFKNGNGFIPPTYAIDIIWHSHMQEPVNYAADCHRLVGYIVYHNPWPMIEDQHMKDSHNQVNQIWEDEFHNKIDDDHL